MRLNRLQIDQVAQGLANVDAQVRANTRAHAHSLHAQRRYNLLRAATIDGPKPEPSVIFVFSATQNTHARVHTPMHTHIQQTPNTCKKHVHLYAHKHTLCALAYTNTHSHPDIAKFPTTRSRNCRMRACPPTRARTSCAHAH